MLEVHVVTDCNRFLYAQDGPPARLALPFRRSDPIPARLLRGDDLPGCPDPVEEGGTVLLGLREGQIVAASRLMPPHGPTRLQGLPPPITARGLPAPAPWADWTRLSLPTDTSLEDQEAIFAAMACAVVDYCLEEGVAWVGGIEDAYWLPRWDCLGWHVEVLGLPAAIGGATRVAAFLRVDEASLAAARRRAGIRHPLLRRHGPQARFLRAGPPHSFSTLRPETDHAC